MRASRVSKAIAAFLSSLVAMLASMGIATPDALTPENLNLLVQAGTVAAAIVTGGVYWAPANRE